MRGPAGIQATGGRRWRTPALVAGSLAVHLLVLGLLGLRAVRLDLPPAERIIQLQLEPRPLLPGETVRTPRPLPSPAAAARPAAGRAGPPPPARPEDEEPAVETPAPRLAAPAPGAPPPPADVDPWRVRPRTLGDRIGQGLRNGLPGCAFRGELTAAQQAVCDQRAAARPAPDITGSGNPERDAGFAAEGARALARYEARRRPLSGGVGVVGPQDGPGSNFGMGVAGAHLDPSLRPDSTSNIRTRRDGPRD
jgi:hypothetical protein